MTPNNLYPENIRERTKQRKKQKTGTESEDISAKVYSEKYFVDGNENLNDEVSLGYFFS